jgi:hypothetical protein
MPTIYVNGDSHSSQSFYNHKNIITASKILADQLKCNYYNQAEPGSSNQRIIRTTIEQLSNLNPQNSIIIIGWSSFERTERFWDGQWYQISGQTDQSIDPALRTLWQKYSFEQAQDSPLKIMWREYIDSFWSESNEACRRMADQHNNIWIFYQLLKNLGYKFIFYQACKTFFFDGYPQQDMPLQLPWAAETWAHNPYVKTTPDNQRIIESFSHFSIEQQCNFIDDLGHFGQDAHNKWAEHLRPRVKQLLGTIT